MQYNFSSIVEKRKDDSELFFLFQQSVLVNDCNLVGILNEDCSEKGQWYKLSVIIFVIHL